MKSSRPRQCPCALGLSQLGKLNAGFFQGDPLRLPAERLLTHHAVYRYTNDVVAVRMARHTILPQAPERAAVPVVSKRWKEKAGT